MQIKDFGYIKIMLIIIAFGCVVKSTQAQTALPASITQNFTATKANSPYIANQDVQVRSGARLTVEPGVTIYFQQSAGLYVDGNIDLTGTETDPIILRAVLGQSRWEVLSINEASDPVNIVWVEFYDCTEGDNSDRDRAAISVRKSEILIDHCTIRNVDAPIFISSCKDVRVMNCILHARTSCDYINFLESDGLIENNEFIGNSSSNTDAIDFDYSQGIIRGNYLHDFTGYNTDAIDIGGVVTDAVIEYNTIENIDDKAISVGERAVADIHYNLIINAKTGIASKDLSVVNASNNTIYQVEYAYQAFSREGVNLGGGFLYIKNSIIYGSDIPVSSLDNSTVTIDYSLCNTHSLSGSGNIQGDPLFVNPGQNNFNLSSGSPAIDAGDPNSPLDPDDTRADIGAFPFSQSTARNLIISEVHYRPVVPGEVEDDYEFLELYNIGSSTIDLSGFAFTAGISFTFSFGVEIQPGEYLLVAKDKTKYNHLSINMVQWWDGDLSNSGENIILKNESNKTVFEFTYSSQFPWPSLGTANKSIEIDPLDQDFTEPGFWRLSKLDGGTPGAPNDMGLIDEIVINEVLSKSTIVYPDDNGNPSDWIELYNNNAFAIDIGGLFVSDIADEPELYMVPESSPSITTIPAGGYLLLYASGNSDNGILHLPFTLMSSGEQFGIFQYYNGEYRTLDFVTFPRMDEGESFGRMPDVSGDFQVIELPSPGGPNEVGSTDKYFDLKINELVAKYDNSYPDEHGLHSDWIEIFNSGQEAVNMAGLFLSDNASDPQKHRILVNISDSAVIESGEYLVFRPDAKTSLGFNHLGFELSSGGEEVLLSIEINGQLEIIDQKEYPSQVQGKSYGRLGDGGKWWAIFGNPTPGSANGTTSVIGVEPDQLNFIVYPNPVKDILTIILTGKIFDVELVEVFDIQGEKWKSWDKKDFEAPIKFELNTQSEAMPSGVYIIRLIGSDNAISKRFVIQ